MRNTQESGQILRSKKRPRRTLRSGRGSRTNSNTSRQIRARVIDAGYLPVAPENLVRRHSRGEEEIIASSNTTLVIIRLARNEHISSAIHPKAEAIATCRDFAFVPIARRGGLLEPSRRNLVISGAFALKPKDSSTEEVLGRRRCPVRLSATRQDRDPARAQRRLWRLMASKTEETSQKEEMPEKEGPETLPDSPLLDLSDAAVKKLIRSAKKRGYVTHDQVKSVLPSEEVNSEQIKDVLAMFSEMGVNVVETEETSKEGGEPREEADEEARSESGELVEVQQKVPAKSEAKEPTERTDDPVRMYLREMGSVKLLSREGEIAIAKRIEAGREAMIAGLCESPLTFQAIIIWRDELNEGKVFLRDIIDLEATYAGPDAKAMPAPVIGPDGQPIVPAPAAVPVPGALAQTPTPPAPPAIATLLKPVPAASKEEGNSEGKPEAAVEDDYDDDMENSLSLAAIEAELKPKVVETFDNIADAYKRLRRLQDQDIQNKLRNDSLSPAQERRYKKLKDDIISEVKSLRLNQARIDALVEQLYDINKRLVGYEGRLMRLAEGHGV